MVLVQTGHRAVVHHIAVVVAPTKIGDATDLELVDILDRHPGKKGCGVRSLDLVLQKRRHIDQASRMSQSEVLGVLTGVVGTGGVVAGPVLPALAPGASIVITINVQVDLSATGSLVNNVICDYEG